MRHWAKGLEIAERWRHDLHVLFASVNRYERRSSRETVLDRVRAKLSTGVTLTPRDISRGLNDVSVPEVREALAVLVESGEAIATTENGFTHYVAAPNAA